jgi:hypothetical protein
MSLEPVTHTTHTAARRALAIAALAVVMELALITPWVDHLADGNATIHSTQHGLIFLGGVLIGFALRDLSRR